VSRTLIWVMTWTVLGPVPEHGEQAKHKTREQCEQARIQKREEYQAQNKRMVSACIQRSKD
jgi:hypothetical protein